MNYKLAENKTVKLLQSPSYNFMFNKVNGSFMRWGATLEEDPNFSAFGPEIADIEISTVCSGIGTTGGKPSPCKFCYKSNTSKGKNMSLETFKNIFDKFPKLLTQIAFGIGDFHANPDLRSIFEYCRANNVVPNVTVNGWDLSDDDIKWLATTCGAVAVSRYNPEQLCFDTVRRLSEAGLQQVNIHQMLCEETYDDCVALVKKHAAEQIKGLKSIVFLLLKPQGRGKCMTQLRDLEKYRKLVNLALEMNVSIGFDSCSCNNFLEAIRESKNYKQLEMCAEPCESTRFSCYIDVEGNALPCSFCEGRHEKVSVLKCNDFLKDIWFSAPYTTFREQLINKTGFSCPVYDLKME